MCNFIIRPIKCYATVDISFSVIESGSVDPIKAGEALTVKEIVDSTVALVRDNDTVVNVPMEIFVHTFSDKDPAKRKDSKESKES